MVAVFLQNILYSGDGNADNNNLSENGDCTVYPSECLLSTFNNN